MKFHDYRPVFRALSKGHRLTQGTPIEIVGTLKKCGAIASNLDASRQTAYTGLKIEAAWTEEKRPYYNVWPSVIEALTKIDLSKVSCRELVLPLPSVMVRFPEGHELGGKVRSFLVSMISTGQSEQTAIIETGFMAPNDPVCLFLQIDDGSWYGDDPSFENVECWLGKQLPTHTTVTTLITIDNNIANQLQYGIDYNELEDGSPDRRIDHNLTNLCFQLLASILLLRNNPDLIECEPLKDNLQEFETANSERKLEIQARAHRKGKIGWDIGKKIEVAPGFRRPHFAVRWMGRGKEVVKRPVIRPVKGCLVKRGKLLEMPTGYLDEEGEEQNG